MVVGAAARQHREPGLVLLPAMSGAGATNRGTAMSLNRRELLGYGASAIGMAGFGVRPLMASAQPADLVLRGGRVITVDAAWRIAEAIAVRDGRFASVGTNAEIAGFVGPSTQVIELNGRTVVPGLIDTRLHQILTALNAPAVQLLSARSIADVQKAIAARAGQTPPGQWVIASSGWHESILEEGRMPTRQELDPVSPNNPVFIPRGGHVVTVNTKALELAGITKDTANPEGGIIVRDASSEATGMLLQNAANLVRKIVPPPPPPADFAKLLVSAMRELNSFGIVGVVEPGIDERGIALYRAVHDSGQMTVRTTCFTARFGRQTSKRVLRQSSRRRTATCCASWKSSFGFDGGVEGGRMSFPYRLVPGEQTNPDYRGVLLLPPGGEDEYVEGLKLIAAAGLQAQTHAVGDETIDLIVRAYGRVDSEIRSSRCAGRSCTSFHPRDAAIARMKEIGIAATVQNHPVLLGHNQRRWWGDDRGVRHSDPETDRRKDSRRRRLRRSRGAVRSVSFHVVDDDAPGAQGLCARARAHHHTARGPFRSTPSTTPGSWELTPNAARSNRANLQISP